jgi:SAM-dependent methyltransferase
VRRVSVPTDRVALLGVGASSLVLDLVASGYCSIDAVDLSRDALNQLKLRLDQGLENIDGVGKTESVNGVQRGGVRFVASDVRNVHFDSLVDLWHDRATLHFLNDPLDQAQYASRAAESVRSGGHLIVATFGANGPEQCSGLPVTRHTSDSLQALFGDSFDLLDCFDVDHTTPWGSIQAFTYAVFQRKGARQ